MDQVEYLKSRKPPSFIPDIIQITDLHNKHLCRFLGYEYGMNLHVTRGSPCLEPCTQSRMPDWSTGDEIPRRVITGLEEWCHCGGRAVNFLSLLSPLTGCLPLRRTVVCRGWMVFNFALPPREAVQAQNSTSLLGVPLMKYFKYIRIANNIVNACMLGTI